MIPTQQDWVSHGRWGLLAGGDLGSRRRYRGSLHRGLDPGGGLRAGLAGGFASTLAVLHQGSQARRVAHRASAGSASSSTPPIGRSGCARSVAVAAATILEATLLMSCADNARLPATAGVGSAPALPSPTQSAIPTIAVAPAEGWREEESPTPAPDLRVTAFARGLDHPRWLLVLPNGDVLVAETNAQPSRPKSLRGVVMKLTQGIAGAEVSSPDRILLLRDADGDGVAETRSVFLAELTSPFGMALVGSDLYVANTNALVRFPYRSGATQIAVPGTEVAALPAGEINHHWTKGLVAGPNGRTMLVSVGSNSDHGENGINEEKGRAAISGGQLVAHSS